MQVEKRQQRQQLRQARSALSTRERHLATSLLEKYLFRYLPRNITHIALYQARGSELDLAHWVREATKRYPRWYFYVPQHYQFTKQMRWIPYRPSRRRQKHYPPSRCLPLQQMNIVLTPLVGVDHLGYRLGQGGGYYDHAFRHLLLKKSPKKIGVGFDCQRLSTEITRDPWDQPLDQFLSEKGRLVFRR